MKLIKHWKSITMLSNAFCINLIQFAMISVRSIQSSFQGTLHILLAKFFFSSSVFVDAIWLVESDVVSPYTKRSCVCVYNYNNNYVTFNNHSDLIAIATVLLKHQILCGSPSLIEQICCVYIYVT